MQIQKTGCKEHVNDTIKEENNHAKNEKTFLSALLACAIIVSLFPFAAFAADANTNVVYVNTNAQSAGTGTEKDPYNDLQTAVTQAGETPTTIILTNNIELSQSVVLEENQKITINGNDKTISYDGNNSEERTKSNAAFKITGSLGDESSNTPANVSLTVNNVKFTSTAEGSNGYGVLVGANAVGANVKLDQCEFNNLYCGILVNQFTNQDANADISITNSTYTNTTYGYSVDEATSGTYVGAVKVQFGSENKSTTDNFLDKEYWSGIVYVTHGGVTHPYKSVADALTVATDGDTITLNPGTYSGNITLNKNIENLTIQGKEGAVIKNGSLTVASSGIQLPGLTIQNLTFENANILMKPNGNSNLSGMTIKDNTFTGAVSAIHFNFGSKSEAGHGANYDGLTITGNDIKDIKNGNSSGILIIGDGTTPSDLTIDNNVIDGVAWNGIQLNNIKGDNIAVTNNEIKNCGATGDDGVFNFYSTTGDTFKVNENKIYPAEGQLYVSYISGNVDLDDNYWGTSNPDFENYLAYNSVDVEKITVDEYYKAPSMNESDLNTYYTGKYSYAINVANMDNGSVSVDKYATEGEKVTLTVSPDKAYKLDELTVTANGKDVELTDNSDGTYTFTMPSSNVKASASFVEDKDYVEPDNSITVSMTIGSNDFVINNNIVTVPDAAPYIANDRTYVPFRALGEALGAKVVWDNDARTVTYTLGDTEIVMTIGDTTYTINGVEKSMDVAPEITGDRTYVPVRFVAEGLGFKVTPLYADNGTTASVVFEK